MLRVVVDRPVAITATLVGLVVLHAVATVNGVVPYIWSGLAQGDLGDVQVPVYLGLASVGAVTAGFAGVVVVFILQANSPAFRRLRRQARTSLTANSVSIIASSISVALIGLVCSLLASTSELGITVWVFEFGALLLAHSLIRALVLFRAMIGVVIADDDKADTEDRQRQIADELSRRRRDTRNAG